MRYLNAIRLLLVCAIVLMGAFCRGSEPIFKATGIYAEKPKPVEAPAPPTPLPEVIDKAITKPEMKPEPEVVKQKPKVTKPNLAGYPAYYEVYGGVYHQTSDRHLIEHGADPALVAILSPQEKNLLHGKFHTEGKMAHHTNQVKAVVPVVRYSSNCPGGVCPTNSYLGRRRR